MKNFGKSRLKAEVCENQFDISGWSFPTCSLDSFVEPPLSTFDAKEFGNADPAKANIILVSAPGAVGKSTLAKEIAVKTGAVLVDLSETGSVGSNFLVGGLAQISGLLDRFKNGKAALVIDGLDEARIKVTSESFGDFFKDVSKLAKPPSQPIVLLGRTGAVQEAWLHLSDNGIEPAVLKIDFLPIELSRKLVKHLVKKIRAERDGNSAERAASADHDAANLLVNRLQDATQGDGSNFVGYAPVLQALARQIATYNNPSELVSQILASEAPITLISIIDSILEREHSKLTQLSLSEEGLKQKLYQPEEQVLRLLGKMYDIQIEPELPEMNPDDKEKYIASLSTWVSEHPFLMDGGTKPSTEVFAGFMIWRGLIDNRSAEIARSSALSQVSKVNPFISAFYLPDDWSGNENGKSIFERLDDVPLVLASHAARVAPPDIVSLVVESDTDEEFAEVEFTWHASSWEKARFLSFKVPKLGDLRFGNNISNVTVTGDDLNIELGDGGEAKLSAPVFFEVNTLLLNCSGIIVEGRPSTTSQNTVDNGALLDVTLRASSVESGVASRPVLRGDVSLSVFWHQSHVFPWIEFSKDPPQNLKLTLRFGRIISAPPQNLAALQGRPLRLSR